MPWPVYTYSTQPLSEELITITDITEIQTDKIESIRTLTDIDKLPDNPLAR